MITAIIADIHGNYKALMAALKDIEKCQCERIICLGDIVEGGKDDTAVIEELRARRIACIIGNHDEFNDVQLSPWDGEFLKSLPESIIEEDVLYTHISPRAAKNKISDPYEAWNIFRPLDNTIEIRSVEGSILDDGRNSFHLGTEALFHSKPSTNEPHY